MKTFRKNNLLIDFLMFDILHLVVIVIKLDDVIYYL